MHTAYIAEVNRSLGLTMYDAPNAAELCRKMWEEEVESENEL